MKKVAFLFLLLCLISQAMGSDLIVTKNKHKYRGKVIKVIKKGFVIKTEEGSVIVLPVENISKIYRGKKIIDFEEMMEFYIETRRPFLPLAILGVATGGYAVKRYQDYKKHRDEANKVKDELGDEASDYQYLSDKSRKDLAWCIVSSLFSVGSFYVALKPMEVKIPIRRIELSTTFQGVVLAFYF